MGKIINIKAHILLLALTASITACSGVTNHGKTIISSGGAKTAYILEKIATPTKWDPEGSVVVEFKHCVQAQPGNEAMIQMLYQAHVDEIEFDKETLADAKANNYSVSTPPVQTTSATLIEACPSSAYATCDKGNVVEHYYTDAEWVLAKFEKSCGYSGSDTWTQN
jgi:ferredoxin-like protein FixX